MQRNITFGRQRPLMSNTRRKSKANVTLRLLCFFPLLLITLFTAAQTKQNSNFKKPLTRTPDTAILLRADTLLPKASAGRIIDSSAIKDTLSVKDSTFQKVDSFDVRISSDSLESPVEYEALDSGVLDIPGKKFYLYGKARAKYTTMDLSASTIEIDNETHMAKAYFTRDSTGKVIDRPKLVDGEMTSEMDSVFYNMLTRKGLSKATYTKQGELFVYAERIKKATEDEYYASKGRFTTCNLDTPHFAFRARKMKLVNQKWAYSGLAYPEFEGVPIPVGIPFGIYPLRQGRHSGLLPPQLAATQQFGIGLEGLGYYKVLNDYFDATIRTNIYSYGGFTVNVTPTYRVRYKYSGGVNFDFQSTKLNFKGDPDYSKTNSFRFGWNHNMDSKARPGTTFSANVNFSSTKFNQLVPNNSYLNFQNNIGSSIQYSKTWGQGKYNLSLVGGHNQNNQLRQYTVNLPNVTMSVNTFYPFQKKERVGTEKWYEKLGVGYSGSLTNQFNFYDSMNLRQIIDTLQWGAQHSIPISLALPSLGPVQLSPSVSFQHKWYGQKVVQGWNPNAKKVDTVISKGFFPASDIAFGLSGQTAIFGTMNFKKGKRVQAIRHVIRPSVGLNYKPDLGKQYYYNVQVDTLGTIFRRSYFDGVVGGPFSEGEFGGLTFSLQNNLEMKVRDKSDTSAESTRKIKLIDNFVISSSYNFFADSFKLSPFSFLIGTSLFEKNPVNISASATLDPYKTDERGRRINQYAWSDGFNLGSFVQGSLSVSTRLQSKTRDGKDAANPVALPQDEYMTPDEQQRQLDYVRRNPAEFTDFNVPWSLDLSYAFNFTRQIKYVNGQYAGFETKTYSSVNLNGDFSLTEKWKMGGTAFYDFSQGSIQNVTMFVTRDLHCWQLSINVTPVGLYRSFNITINPKSGILRDLKINRTRYFYQ